MILGITVGKACSLMQEDEDGLRGPEPGIQFSIC